MRRRSWRAGGGLLVLLLAACSVPLQPVDDAPLPVWPPSPDAPRVAFVRAFSRPADLGIGKGLVARLADLLFGDSEARLVRPMAVVEHAGVILVADPGVRGVHRFDPRRGDYALLAGPGGMPLPSPVGLAVGADGEIYVSDSRLGQVFVVRPGANEAEPLALGAPLRQPTGLAFDAGGRRLYVADTAAHRVLAFDAAGTLVATLGRRGEAAGEFNFPTLLSFAAGRLYVTDSLNFRVQVLDGEGRFLASVGRHGDAVGDTPRPKGAAADRRGHLYVADAVHHNLQIFDVAGRFLLPVGQQGAGRGEFLMPTGVFVGGDDHIYVADAYNRRVQVLRYVGARG